MQSPWDVFLEGVHRRKSLDDLAERRLWNLSGEVPVLADIMVHISDFIRIRFDRLNVLIEIK